MEETKTEPNFEQGERTRVLVVEFPIRMIFEALMLAGLVLLFVAGRRRG